MKIDELEAELADVRTILETEVEQHEETTTDLRHAERRIARVLQVCNEEFYMAKAIMGKAEPREVVPVFKIRRALEGESDD